MIKILVLEDDEQLNKTMCAYLCDNGFDAKGFLNAQNAYEEMYNNLYDLIISDIMMPQTDGFEFATTVRKINKNIPIIFVTAREDFGAKQKGFQLGIDDYMTKPVDLAELVLRINALLRRSHIENERKIVAGNLELDADGMTASIKAKKLHLQRENLIFCTKCFLIQKKLFRVLS